MPLTDFLLFDIEEDVGIFSFSFLFSFIKEKYDSSLTDEILFFPRLMLSRLLFSFSVSNKLISGLDLEFLFFIKLFIFSLNIVKIFSLHSLTSKA